MVKNNGIPIEVKKTGISTPFGEVSIDADDCVVQWL